MYAIITTERKQVIPQQLVTENKRNRMASNGSTYNGGPILTVAMCLAMLVILIQSSSNSLAECQEQLTVESRQQKDQDLTKTIDYLEKLDKYFSQIARPRFGRSEFKRPMVMGHFGSAFQPIGAGGSMEPAQFDSLVELINSRLAKKYRDSMNY